MKGFITKKEDIDEEHTIFPFSDGGCFRFCLISGSVLAEDTLLNKAASTVDSTGAKIDSSMKKVDNYMSDSAVTAKVKSALLEEKSLKSTDISVETSNGVVTLSGFLNSQAEIETAVEIAGNVEGVKSVSDKLHVKDQKSQSVSEYAGDAATTSSVKAKLLADDIVPSRKIKVETTDGVVQLSVMLRIKPNLNVQKVLLKR